MASSTFVSRSSAHTLQVSLLAPATALLST